MRHVAWLLLLPLALLAAACDPGPDLETRTFQVQYLPQYEVRNLVEPYVYADREGAAGRLSASEGAITVRETEDNLERIARVLAEYDRPRPAVMLHFQFIRADGAGESDPAIADVERELRRLFRFEGYQLMAEAKLMGIAGTALSQLVRPEDGDQMFSIEGGVSEVRTGDAGPTVTIDVEARGEFNRLLSTTVTVPTDHTVVLGTGQAEGIDGALILTVRAELVESVAPDAPTEDAPPENDAAPADA